MFSYLPNVLFVLRYLSHVDFTEHYVINLMDIDGVRTSCIIFLVHASCDAILDHV